MNPDHAQRAEKEFDEACEKQMRVLSEYNTDRLGFKVKGYWETNPYKDRYTLILIVVYYYLFYLSMDKGNFLYLLLGFILIFIWILFRGFYKKTYTSLSSKNEEILDALRQINTPDQIISLTEKAYELLKSVLRKRWIFYFLCHSEALKIYDELIKYQTKLLLTILQDGRHDLLSEIRMQSGKLISSKLEISNVFTGTPELEQVSELQKARLDRQIEQFEELQRVLVKM